jgi:hypothetical protein
MLRKLALRAVLVLAAILLMPTGDVQGCEWTACVTCSHNGEYYVCEIIQGDGMCNCDSSARTSCDSWSVCQYRGLI